MAEQTIVRAELIELKDDLSDVLPGGKRVPVQFNPETLKLSYANQMKEQNNASAPKGKGAGNQSQGTPARQFVGAGTTKLVVQLTFDVTAATGEAFMVSDGARGEGAATRGKGDIFQVDDVRRVTAQVLYFMKPKDPGAGAKDASQRVPPGLRFLWGRFLFDGIVESVEENVEYFSADGKALRASMTLNLIQQTILVPAFKDAGRVDPRREAVGGNPLALARGGQSLQQMSDGLPGGGAAAGGPGAGFGGGLSASVGASFGGSVGVSASLGGGIGGGIGIGGSASLGAGVGGGLAASPGAAFGAGGWQRIAAANGIENPRAIEPGKYIDLTAQRPTIVTG